MLRLTLLALLTTLIQSYTTFTLPQRSSYFVGSSVSHHDVSTVNNKATHATLTMKKGKANVPPQLRSQYTRAQEMESYRRQMVDSQSYGNDGLPVFNLYVRTGLKNVSTWDFCVWKWVGIWDSLLWCIYDIFSCFVGEHIISFFPGWCKLTLNTGTGWLIQVFSNIHPRLSKPLSLST